MPARHDYRCHCRCVHLTCSGIANHTQPQTNTRVSQRRGVILNSITSWLKYWVPLWQRLVSLPESLPQVCLHPHLTRCDQLATAEPSCTAPAKRLGAAEGWNSHLIRRSLYITSCPSFCFTKYSKDSIQFLTFNMTPAYLIIAFLWIKGN